MSGERIFCDACHRTIAAEDNPGHEFMEENWRLYLASFPEHDWRNPTGVELKETGVLIFNPEAMAKEYRRALAEGPASP